MTNDIVEVLRSIWHDFSAVFGSTFVSAYLFPTFSAFYFGYVIFNVADFFSIRRGAEKVVRDSLLKIPSFDGSPTENLDRAHSFGTLVMNELLSLSNDFHQRGHYRAGFELLEIAGRYSTQPLELIEQFTREGSPNHQTVHAFVVDLLSLSTILVHGRKVRGLRPSWFVIFGGHWFVSETRMGTALRDGWRKFRFYLRGTGDWP